MWLYHVCVRREERVGKCTESCGGFTLPLRHTRYNKKLHLLVGIYFSDFLQLRFDIKYLEHGLQFTIYTGVIIELSSDRLQALPVGQHP